MGGKRIIGALVALAVVGPSACGEKDEPAFSPHAETAREGHDEGAIDQNRTDLLGRTFKASLAESNASLLTPDRRVTVGFHRRGGPGDGIGWHAGCNGFGARVEIAPSRLRLGAIAGTLIKCPEAEQAQDRRLGKFFGSDPRWQLRDDTLTLASGGMVLVARAKNPG